MGGNATTGAFETLEGVSRLENLTGRRLLKVY